MILDTSFLIDLFDGRRGAFEKGLDLSEAQTVQRVPSPVVMELTYGAEFGDEEERRNVRNALRMYPVSNRTRRLLTALDSYSHGQTSRPTAKAASTRSIR